MLTLKAPVNFVIDERRLWPEIKNGSIDQLTDDILAQRGKWACDNWVSIPYVYFRRAGFDVTTSARPIRGAINIVSGLDLGIRDRGVSPFIVACRADGHEPKLANYIFEQNNLRGGAPNVSWTPHVPQPGLIKRDPARGSLIETIAYMGALGNLDLSFRDDAFRKGLKALDVKLELRVAQLDSDEPMLMHDYHDVDLVIAARKITTEDVKTKPASKLVNAWLAGAPALLGPEPAFMELYKSELDFLVVESPEDALSHIKMLQANPKRYEEMVANGVERAQLFSIDAILAQWVELLNGPVFDAFICWEDVSEVGKLRHWVAGAIGDKLAKRRAAYHRNHGAYTFGKA